MQFAAEQIFGRVAKRCVSAATQHAYEAGDGRLSEPVVSALTRFLELLRLKIPRSLSAMSTSTWFIFTDASHEPGPECVTAGVGAVLVNSLGEKANFFSEQIAETILRTINASRRKTIIFECEFFAVFCAMLSWREKLTRCNVVIHTDNDGVRDSFISCHITSENAVPILNACLQLEFEAAMNTWITRVPTESNVADNPFDVTSLTQRGCTRTSFDPCSMWRTMSDRNWGGSAT